MNDESQLVRQDPEAEFRTVRQRTTDHGQLTSSWITAILITLAIASPSRADTLKLKDGQKISGTIVGFENGMFRVETDYGFILVRKDKVTSIDVTASEAKAGKQPAASEAKLAQAKSETPDEGAKSAGDASRAEKQERPTPRPTGSESNAASSAPPRPTPQPPAPPPKPVSRPLNEPLPAHIDEHVEGNTYVNDTFHFAMYKPPDWKLYEEIHREKVSAIVALASEDEQTVLFVDRQVWSGAPDLKNEGVEAKLRQTYQDYKVVSESDTQVDGRPAIRRRFDGILDGTDWHGVAVRVAEGSTVYGIIGLTSAETFQFQESLFNKIARSFHFLTPTAENVSSPRAPRSP